MTSKKTTRRALFSSMIALLLSVSMLVGSTFAWFTDSVTSANNIIKSGNLDVELYYQVEGQSDWTKVDANTNVFMKDALWEPGHTEVVKLKIVNEGTLALKYQLGVNVDSETGSKNVAGDEFKLSKYIEFGIVEGEKSFTREQAVAAVADTATALEKAYSSKVIKLMPKTDTNTDNEDIVTMVVYMPTTVGNEANHATGEKVPTINLGINLFATQLDAESDSFGPDYDEDAWHEEMQVFSAQDLQAAVTNAEPGTEIVLMEDVEITEPIVIPAAATTYSLRSAPAVAINLNGKTITTAYNEQTQKHAYAIDNYGNLVIEGGTIEARGIYNREGATMTVNGTKIVNLDTNGGSSIWSYGGSVVLNDAELIGYTGCVYSDGYLEINGGTYTCYSAILDDGTQLTPTYNIRSNGKLVINGGDFTSRHGLVAAKGNTVINGGTYTMNNIGVITSHVFYVWGAKAEVTVNGGEFNCDLRTAQANGSSMICVDAADVTVSVKGGTYNLNPEKYVAAGCKAVASNGKFVVAPENAGVVITTPAELVGLGNTSVKGNIYLAADLDMSGYDMQPIMLAGGDDSELTFLGNGHTISNLNLVHATQNGMSVAAMFNVMYSGKAINVQDLTLKNATSTSSKYAAVVVAYNSTEKTAINLNNVDVNGATITAETVAPLVGYTTGPVNLNGCDVSNITLTGEKVEKMGAYVGTANTATCVVTVANCTNSTAYNAAGRVINDATMTIDGAAYVTNADGLAKAVAAGATNIMLADGEYDVSGCGGKTLTISGSKNAVLKVMNEGEDGCDYAFGGPDGVGNVTFNGVTIDTTANTGNYKGFAYMKGTYNNCNFVGAFSLNNDNDYEFNNCTFDFKNGYFWTWGAKSVSFNGCTFNGNSKTILAHGFASTVIKINNCTFAAAEKGYTGAGDNTAAVEIDPAGTNVYTIKFTGENTITDSYAGWTRVKDNSTGHTITGLN